MKAPGVTACLLCGLFCGALGFAAEVGAEEGAMVFPDTAAGRRAGAYFDAFNSGDENAVRAFFEENVARASLEARPVDERMAVYRRLKGDLAVLTPVKVVRATEDALTVIARSSTDKWVQLTFDLEKEPPHGIAGIGVRLLPEPPDLDQPTTPLTEAQFLEELRAYMGGLVGADEFSGVVLVATGEEPLFKKAYGLASKEYGVPNRLDTRFNLGSINKFITQIAVEQIVGKGLLGLDDSIGKYLPDYPNRDAAAKVTVRHLLDMTSGIGDFFGDRYRAAPKDRIRDLDDYLPLFAEDPLLFDPGTSSRYSNGGYVVLGLIVEKASGRTYFDYVRDNIYSVAGMEATGHLEADEPTENVASGYTHNWGEDGQLRDSLRNNIYTRPARGSSAGGGYSTADDLVRLVAALRRGNLSAPRASAAVAGQGFGIAGGAPGISAFLGTAGGGRVVVVLSNYDSPTAVKVGEKIQDLLGRLR
jgi:D-alanyl-D-alanine carboxypeptidase